ncbi:MAG: hypothetical protein LiPW41_67 [Parcubacteria group bacterium LiPW_41]|nr:MAG: hypothetical protein LiPW41_67 [Parcubacteria group bacterium LiPW_41]
MKTNTRAAIYDLDGTLLNSGKEGFIRLCGLAEKNGINLNPKVKRRLKKEWGLPPIELIATGFEITKKFAREIHRQWVEADKIDPIPLVKGVPELLQRNIDNGIINFVFTSRKKRSARNVLKQFNVIHFFEDVVGTDGGIDIPRSGFRKPDPRSLNCLLQFIEENYGIQKNQIAYIGDEIVDIQCGVGAGVKTFGVTSGLKKKHELKNAAEFEVDIFPTVIHIVF